MRIFILVAHLLLLPVAVSAQTDHNLRLLFHGTKQVAESNFGMSGWIVAPNVTSVSDKWMVVTGPRYDGNNWWVEFMGGSFVQDGEATPLIDVRISPPRLGSFSTWANLEWIDLGSSEDLFYSYLQADYVLQDVGLVGIESENVYQEGEDVLSLGPHIVIPFNTVVLVAAYQFHRNANNQMWFRMVVNF